ncbi:MAG: Rrf2 family transcriptional regulator [Bacteroidales bacterium]|jgi:Rrf2 family protein|nr:Rrf2 family transcriptional regulator [Bacteroidales bacterium]
MLSATCKYGIRAVLFIASRPDKKTNTGLRMIAEELKVPQPYLAKILQILSKKKILGSTKGPHGGFCLEKPESELTLMDIIEAIDGGDFFDSCYITGKRCSFDNPDKAVCILHNDLREEKVRLSAFFRSKTVEALVLQVRSTPEVRI